MKKTYYFQCLILQNWKKYIVVILLVLIQCRLFRTGAKQWAQIQNMVYELSVSDYIIDFFRGTLPYTMSGQLESFNIPPILSLYLIYYFALIGKSVADTESRFRIQCTLRMGSRKRWWLQQNISIWSETILYLLVTFSTFLVYGFCTGVSLSGGNRKFHLSYSGMDIRQFFIFQNVLLPCLFILTALAYIQYVVSLRGNVFIGIILSTTIWICSVFHWNPLLPGNYLMAVRHSLILADNASYMTGIGWSVGIIILMYFAGRHITKHKDIF